MVTGTKKKWLIVTNANCQRARSTFMVLPGPDHNVACTIGWVMTTVAEAWRRGIPHAE
jgi:hypothetical protein